MLPSVQSEVFCGAVHSALWHDLPPSTRDWEETAVKLQKLGFRSYLLVISWRFLQGVGEFSEGLKYYVDAVESLLQHGLEPVLVLDFNVPQQTCQDFQSPLPAQLAQVMDAFIPHVRCWFTLLEHSRNLPGKSPEVKRRWHSEHSDPFHCARLGDAAAQLALAQQGVALGVLLAIDWLEPGDAGDGGMAKELTERIMRRQMASFCWENSEKSNGTNGGHGNNGSMSSMSLGYGNKADVKSPFRDRSIMILPRYAGHIHVLAPRDVKISDMSSLDFKTLKKMVKWFREEAGLADDAAIHIIASIHTPVSQIFHGIQHIHHMNERLGIEGIPQSFAGFWIDEENAMNAMSIDARPKLPQSFQTSSPFEVMEEIRRLFSTSGDLGASGASTLSFLVALSALEHLGDLDDQTISRISAAIKGSVGTDGMHGTHGTDGVPPVATSQTASPASPASRQAKWDRTLSGAVNFRRKKSRDFATLAEMEMEIMDPTGHPTPQTQTQQICDLAAQIFLSWRRKMRGSLESEMMCFCGHPDHPDHPDPGRLHIPSILASLEAVLLLSQVQLPELRFCQKACLALRAAKESSTRSLPPLQPLPLQPSAKPAQSQSNDVEAAGLAALFVSWSLHGATENGALRWPNGWSPIGFLVG